MMYSAEKISSGGPWRSIRSPRTQTTQSLTFWARSSSWRLMSTASCRRRTMSFSMASSSSLWRMSRKEVGSSSTSTSGSWHRARASSTRWRWPSLMREKSCSASPEAWTSSRHWDTFSRSSRLRMPSRPV